MVDDFLCPVQNFTGEFTKTELLPFVMFSIAAWGSTIMATAEGAVIVSIM